MKNAQAVRLALLVFVLALMPMISNAQRISSDGNVVTTAVPFLAISPDSRSGAMGDVGVATSADANSIHWNPAKLAFLEDDARSFSASYIPWLQSLVPDINLAYLSYAHKIDKNQAFAASFRYFSLGNIQYTDIQGNSMGDFESHEFAFSGAYSLKLSNQLSAGVALRYIYSNLTQAAGQANIGENITAGQSFASDVSLFYEGERFVMEGGQTGRMTAGLNISNLGTKIRYTETEGGDFIPTNLRLGTGFIWGLDQYVELGFYADLNKLLVPTPPEYDDDGNIVAGRDPNVPFFQGVFQSFNDAPGGFSEELQEIVYNLGVEMWYDEKFALRAGYQHESWDKGGRQYATLGLGLRFNVFGLDFSYLIPTTRVRNPLENTLRFTLFWNFHKAEAR
ncbi:MAG: type IX secretion system outer membrane channel protein PorV [Cryomorphaceae bacterium]|nr:type IX secretion system outer membrane channel protein PorV [Cryomorphaceae bacterium]